MYILLTLSPFSYSLIEINPSPAKYFLSLEMESICNISKNFITLSKPLIVTKFCIFSVIILKVLSVNFNPLWESFNRFLIAKKESFKNKDCSKRFFGNCMVITCALFLFLRGTSSSSHLWYISGPIKTRSFEWYFSTESPIILFPELFNTRVIS